MAARAPVIWITILYLGCSSAQQLGSESTNSTGKICLAVNCNKSHMLEEMLKDCVVVLGNLRIVLMEQAHKEDFVNISFPKLREVTGYLAFYRVNGLESLGKLFPNLARIRGRHVLFNYALIVYDMANLKEVGLYSLLKIDRGGVIVWVVPHTCFVNTINWRAIAPNYRHILSPVEDNLHCSSTCPCSANSLTNYCWNVKKCQRFPDGSDESRCNEQCLGCRGTNPDECTICRYFTNLGRCVAKCPIGTIVLQHNNYCITEAECREIGAWAWNGTCVFSCTIGYKKQVYPNRTVCLPCDKCEETCGSLRIQTIGSIQESGKCVHIKGSLTIHVRSTVKAMDELKTYLGQIQDVSDYIVIYGSLTITSLEFLTSLKRIGGQNLRNGTHSLIVYDMTNLQSLFTENVTQHLNIERGTMYFYNNPMLCVSEINKIQHLFPLQPGPLDIPQGTNGYSGGCTKASIGLNLDVINETAVLVNFTYVQNIHAHYSILYIRLPQSSKGKVFVPETCSDSEWHAYNIPFHLDIKRDVVLTNLRPASSYALCIEKYDTETKVLGRSEIFNFTTPVGKPEPPFILELVASSDSVVVLRWVNHKMYGSHIKRYELDVTLVEIYSKDVQARDHCEEKDNSFEEIDYFRHAVVMRPPPDYDRGCESMCGILSTMTAGAMVEEYFDVCSSIEFGCNDREVDAPKNSSFGNFVRTLSLNISGPRNDFQVGGLAPFRDYRFRLRACSNDECSRYARGVVRTMRSENADIPIISFASASESGYISVKWNPPTFTNGPVLSYTVTVLPLVKYDESGKLLPQTWCESSDKSSVVVKAAKAQKYMVSVCSTTLASRNACSERLRVITVTEVTYFSWWWTGIIFGIFLYSASVAIGCFWKKRRNNIYELPLLESMDLSHSEPPTMMMSDFIYTIPLRDTQLD